jgi:hypothetical protein
MPIAIGTPKEKLINAEVDKLIDKIIEYPRYIEWMSKK